MKKLKVEQVRRIRSFFVEELLLTAAVLFLPILYMTAAFALLADIGIDMERGRWVFPTGLLLWGIAIVALHREEKWQKLVATLLLFLAVFALTAWATSLYLDRGQDSRFYHALAILGLLEGVNPYWEPRSWITYTYPTAHWLLSASLIVWTQSFEASFALTGVAVVAAFLCARRFLATPTLSHLSGVWRNVLAFLLAANPVATWCFFVHYNDGLLVSTLLSVSMLMLCFVSEGKAQSRTIRFRAAFCIASLLIFLVNIKFTGLVYGGILGLTALAYGARRGASRKTLVHLAGLGSGAAILGVALFGFFPYATNMALHKNPFYPAISFAEKDKTKDIVGRLFDKEFYAKSSYEKWWISLFSERGKDYWTPAPLPPFSLRQYEAFYGGFGTLFSGSLLLCLTLVFFVRHRGAWFVLAGVMVSVISTRVSFAFRLTPQNWWLPVLLLVFLLAPDEKQSSFLRAQRAQRIVVFVVVACLLYLSVQRLRFRHREALWLAQVVQQAEQEGGWFVVPDTNMLVDWHIPIFFNYYDSGLSGVRLPTMSQCPYNAPKRELYSGLTLCKPQ